MTRRRRRRDGVRAPGDRALVDIGRAVARDDDPRAALALIARRGGRPRRRRVPGLRARRGPRRPRVRGGAGARRRGRRRRWAALGEVWLLDDHPAVRESLAAASRCATSRGSASRSASGPRRAAVSCSPAPSRPPAGGRPCPGARLRRPRGPRRPPRPAGRQRDEQPGAWIRCCTPARASRPAWSCRTCWTPWRARWWTPSARTTASSGSTWRTRTACSSGPASASTTASASTASHPAGGAAEGARDPLQRGAGRGDAVGPAAGRGEPRVDGAVGGEDLPLAAAALRRRDARSAGDLRDRARAPLHRRGAGAGARAGQPGVRGRAQRARLPRPRGAQRGARGPRAPRAAAERAEPRAEREPRPAHGARLGLPAHLRAPRRQRLRDLGAV